jgi:hypothetical protein
LQNKFSTLPFTKRVCGTILILQIQPRNYEPCTLAKLCRFASPYTLNVMGPDGGHGKACCEMEHQPMWVLHVLSQSQNLTPNSFVPATPTIGTLRRGCMLLLFFQQYPYKQMLNNVVSDNHGPDTGSQSTVHQYLVHLIPNEDENDAENY